MVIQRGVNQDRTNGLATEMSYSKYRMHSWFACLTLETHYILLKNTDRS